MIERILKHMNIYKEMKNAAIPLKLIGKKGEDFCMNAARLVNQQELSGLMEGLNEETISSLMDDPEMLTYLGKMNKKDFSILEPDRIRMIVECAGNEKLSEFPYEKIEKVLADKEIPDRIVYVYLKYYAFLEPKEELKKQLVASLETCIGEFDVARAGIKIRMLLINPAFSTELLYELLKDEESLALLLKQDLMELVNYLSEFCKETESLNKKQLEELSRHPKEIRNGLEVILTQIPKEWQASFLHLWLWNESLYADIPKLIRFLTGPDADFEKVSNGKAAYVNTLYGNPLPDMDLYELTLEKTERGAVKVNERMQTSLSNVYVCGDLTGFSLLAHTAVREAEVAVHSILGKEDAMSYRAIPGVVYTNPEIAGLGETEESASTKGINYQVIKLPMAYSGRFVAENEGVNGVCKVLLDEQQRVIGAHVLGNPASEIITLAGTAIELGLTAAQWKKIVFPHPTVGEIFRETL